jgi:quercetin dioxygenase-like cupin family protein
MTHSLRRSWVTAAAFITGVVPLVAVASAGSAAPTPAETARAAPPPTIVELLSRGTVDKRFDAEGAGVELETDGPIDVAVVRVTYPPGATSGWHRHPGPTVVTATKGTFRHVIGKHCMRHTITAGETFVEKGPHELGVLRNVGDTEAEIIITFYAPVGADPLTIPARAPACSRRAPIHR